MVTSALLNNAEKVLIIYLLSFKYSLILTYKCISFDLGMTIQSVKKHIVILKKKGFLIKTEDGLIIDLSKLQIKSRNERFEEEIERVKKSATSENN